MKNSNSNWKNVNIPVKYLHHETAKSFKVVIPQRGHFFIPKSQCRIQNGTLNIGINQDWDNYTFTNVIQQNGGEPEYIPTPEMSGVEFYDELLKYEV